MNMSQAAGNAIPADKQLRNGVSPSTSSAPAEASLSPRSRRPGGDTAGDSGVANGHGASGPTTSSEGTTENLIRSTIAAPVQEEPIQRQDPGQSEPEASQRTSVAPCSLQSFPPTGIAAQATAIAPHAGTYTAMSTTI